MDSNEISVVVGYSWFTHQNKCIGVVLRKDFQTDKYQAYIGCVLDETISDEISDAKHIADWGAKLNFEQARGFFPNLPNFTKENYKQ